MSQKSPGCFAGILMAIVCAIGWVIYNSGAMWYVICGVVFVIVAVFAVMMRGARRKELEKRIRRLSAEIDKHNEMIRHGKTVTTRLNHCSQAIELLKQIQELDPSDSICKDSAGTLLEFRHFSNTIPIQDAMQRAEKAVFKGKNREALNCLLDAIFHCEKEKLTDKDVDGILAPESGAPITIEYLKSKATALGWTPNR